MIEPRIVVALANSVWQSAILVALTMVMLRIMSRTSANLRYAVWLATLAVCLLLPVVDYAFVRHVSEPAPAAASPSNLPSATTETSEAQYVITPRALRSSLNARTKAHSSTAVGSSTTRVYTVIPAAHRSAVEVPIWLRPATLGAFVARFTSKASRALFWLWIVVADVLLARILLQLVSLIRAKRRIEIIDTFDWICQRPGVKRHYSVGISDTLDIPCLLGLTEPLIAIPRAIADELSSNDLRRIVVHESAHVRRYDDWVNLFEQCVLALLFFSPALYFATRALHLEREIACDDQVVATDERLFYAECLSVLAGRARIRSTSFVPSFFSGRRELLIRIEQLLDRKHVAHAPLGLIPYAVAVMLGAFALVLGQTGIPVLAAPTQAPAPAPTQQPPANIAPASPHAKPAPKVVRAPRIVQTTQTITVRVIGKPETSHVSSRLRVRRGAESATQTVTESETFVVNGKACTASAVKVMPAVGPVTPSEATGPVVVAPVIVSQETAATRVAPAPCLPAPAVAPGTGHHVMVIDSNTKVVIVCTKSLPRVHMKVRMTDADLKAFKAAGCTVSEPIDARKVRMDSLHDVDMNAIHAEVDRTMAEMQKSMLSMPRDHDLRQLDAATRALAKSQAEMMRHHGAMLPPMKIDTSTLKIVMPEMHMLDDTTLPQLPVKEITDMANHGVTGAYITSLSHVGYAGLSAADYIRLHDSGVTAESIKRLTSGHPGTKLSVDDLIRLQH